MIAEETLGADLVAVEAALLRDRRETVANLHALHRVDRHQRRGEFAIELAVDRFAPARRQSLGNHVDTRADGIARLAQGVHVAFEFADLRGVGPEERIGFDSGPVDAVGIEAARHDVTDLGKMAAHLHAVLLR